jgi:pimeloyl-ACP methyl ester carboxylesterase
VASLDWLQHRAIRENMPIDPRRIVIVGHSMGGFVAAHTVAERPDILGTALISGVDLGRAFGGRDKENGANAVDRNVGVSEGLHILTGTLGRRSAPQRSRVAAGRLCSPSSWAPLAYRDLRRRLCCG